MGNPEQFLAQRGIHATANRILVLKALAEAVRPESLLEIDYRILTMDRSSVFRCLKLFAEHHVVHEIDDGSGSIKYELCHGDGHCTREDMHVHFYCEQCQRTICLEALPIPAIELPEGFVPEAFNFVIKGICPDCAKR